MTEGESHARVTSCLFRTITADVGIIPAIPNRQALAIVRGLLLAIGGYCAGELLGLDRVEKGFACEWKGQDTLDNAREGQGDNVDIVTWVYKSKLFCR